jgi:saccharopine dehydrogenase-like NADP-dependent oxidoreductase
MSTLHWLGVGLSSRPGLERWVRSAVNSKCILWSRNETKAQHWVSAIASPNLKARAFTPEALVAALHPGDIVVSMLPAEMHLAIARICLSTRAHLVTTSYLSPEMRDLGAEAQALGLVFMNEVGLDPGIDHLFAHLLVDRLRQAVPSEEMGEIELYSLCGGFPRHPDAPFCYRFSWSQLGVLRALQRPARWLDRGILREAPRPYAELSSWDFGAEALEMYPNRDSIPYRDEYGLTALGGQLHTLMRGTLRPPGWSSAWKIVFAEIEKASPAELIRIAEHLYREYPYRNGQSDRVCMEVRLVARDRRGILRFNQSYRIDETGDANLHSAMARLVSYPAILAVESILAGRVKPGVTGAPKDARLAQVWLDRLVTWGCSISGE